MLALKTFAASVAGLVVEQPIFRQISKKLDAIMANQADLDTKLTELKQSVADAAQRVSDKLASLNPQSPTFDSEVADIQSDIDALTAIAPAPAGPDTQAAQS